MFGIGSTELLVIILVGILVLGPEHLPRILRTVQKFMTDFRRVSTEFQRAVNLESHQEEFLKEQRTQRASSGSGAVKKKKKKKAPPPDAATTQPPAEATDTAPAAGSDPAAAKAAEAETSPAPEEGPTADSPSKDSAA